MKIYKRISLTLLMMYAHIYLKMMPCTIKNRRYTRNLSTKQYTCLSFCLIISRNCFRRINFTRLYYHQATFRHIFRPLHITKYDSIRSNFDRTAFCNNFYLLRPGKSLLNGLFLEERFVLSCFRSALLLENMTDYVLLRLL